MQKFCTEGVPIYVIYICYLELLFRDAATDVFFVIGGADGLSPELRGKAKFVIAFGAATWPHQMVRVMLLEQIYRAATILAGHPYHRA